MERRSGERGSGEVGIGEKGSRHSCDEGALAMLEPGHLRRSSSQGRYKVNILSGSNVNLLKVAGPIKVTLQIVLTYFSHGQRR